MATDDAQHQCTSAIVVNINKIMLTHEDFRRLKEGEWLNCKVCVNICSYDTLHMHVHMDVCIHIFMMTCDNLNVYLCM